MDSTDTGRLTVAARLTGRLTVVARLTGRLTADARLTRLASERVDHVD